MIQFEKDLLSQHKEMFLQVRKMILSINGIQELKKERGVSDRGTQGRGGGGERLPTFPLDNIICSLNFTSISTYELVL